jgi:hypothetical protein
MFRKIVRALKGMRVLLGTLLVGIRLWDVLRDKFDDWP